MDKVRPKKNLGQHFLKDEAIAKQIVESLTGHGDYETLLEIGPGTGVLSQFLMQKKQWQWWGLDIDTESVAYLKKHFPAFEARILEKDFLSVKLDDMFPGDSNVAIIGNFPYNISTQILFKVLENRSRVTEMVGMFQKEVAQRVMAGPGGKVNGILSILCQAFYDIEYLFQVNENVFHPPPKVKSAVIRMKRNEVNQLDCDEKLFFSVVKMAYNQRRKTLRNALKPMKVHWEQIEPDLSGQRAEQLSVNEFVRIVKAVPEQSTVSS